MGNLGLFTSNRLEILADQLARVLRKTPASAFEPEIIVVQSKGMERWICLQLAERHGVCANCRFPFPNVFVQEILDRMLGDLPKPSVFDPEVMTWRVMKILPRLLQEPAFAPLRIYLERDQADLKCFQLSERIADLFDQYLLFRPEMMFQWERGKASHWQAILWRTLVEGHEREHRAALAGNLFAAVERRSKTGSGLPARVSVFGISALPRFHVQVFASLSRICEVNFFLMNPCREYWGDILAPWEMRKTARRGNRVSDHDLHMETGNPLLVSMGALGRDFFEMIQEFPMEESSRHEEPEGSGLLACIQRDILTLREREEKEEIAEDDDSIRIHSCHSPMREVEVLRDQILRMFEEIPGLLPKDILVMMPDIETYAPYIQAVFDTTWEEGRRIPFSIADRSIRKEGRIGETLLYILDLEGSRFGVPQVLNLLECEAVRRKFDFSDEDLDRVRTWISETGIRWGIDERHKVRLGLPPFRQNTWRAGLDRLLLGFAMPGRGEKLCSGILPYDRIEGGETRILGGLTDFVERLFNRVNSLERPKALEEWQRELSDLLNEFFEPQGEEAREIQLILGTLDELVRSGRAAGFDEEVRLRVVKSYLERRMDQTGFGLGFMTGGVTFCAMLPMRSIPFRVICLLGMNGEAYPRPSIPLGFDYMARSPRRGDRSRRNDDRYLFLEALLSVRDRLYISYVGQSIQDNSAISPSVLVSELVDYVEQGFRMPGRSIREHLQIRHRLQAFSPEYFKNRRGLFTYSKESFETAQTLLTGRREPGPFLARGLSEPDQAWRTVDLRGLCAFYSNPAKFLLTRRLGIDLEERGSLIEEREPFVVESLERYLLEQDMLGRRLRGRARKEDFMLAAASGKLPHGSGGRGFYESLGPGVEHFAEALLPWIGRGGFRTLDFRLDVAGFCLAGSLEFLGEERMLYFRYGGIRGKDRINAWICHVVLQCILERRPQCRTLLAGLSSKSGRERKAVFYEFVPVEHGPEILAGLLKRYWEGLRKPLPFFPESSWTYAERRFLQGKDQEEALRRAREKWEGGEFARGEVEDPYYQLCFARQDPVDFAFADLAGEIFEPMLKHLEFK